MINSNICDWVKRQPYWEQRIGNAILKGTELSERDLDEIYLLFKSENGLIEQRLERNHLELLGTVNQTNSKQQVKLKSISSITGVNALSPNEEYFT